jgi:hypothetical protein
VTDALHNFPDVLDAVPDVLTLVAVLVGAFMIAARRSR